MNSDALNTPAELQAQLTGLALRIAKEGYGIELDFSNASVQQVEFILADVHENYVSTQNDEGLEGIDKMHQYIDIY
jgi:hypothetical protein